MLMDAARLMQAFENLIINAIQHSKSGSEVFVEVRRNGEFIECAVRDRGPGFHPDDLPRVFEPFFTRRRGGTGLGLAIVQRIIEEHGGTLHAANGESGGAIVSVRFPIYEKMTP
jgi:signal transduction histidine kinase